MAAVSISQWIPVKQKRSDGKAWESPNMHIWLSLKTRSFAFHLSIGRVAFTVENKRRKS